MLFGFRPKARRTSDGEAANGDAKCDVTTRSKGHRHTSSIHAKVSDGARMSAKAARMGALTTLSVIASYPGHLEPSFRNDKNTACRTDFGQKSSLSYVLSSKDVRKMSGALLKRGIQDTASVTNSVLVSLWKKAASLTGPALP